jgi:hypothetical protein
MPKAVALDANLLVLLMVGLTKPAYISFVFHAFASLNIKKFLFSSWPDLIRPSLISKVVETRCAGQARA